MSRDITLGETIYVKFTTRQFSTGAPFTLAGSPVVSAYEDDSVTQITAGITLTADFDSVTGLNHLTIVATAGNGFEAGKDYSLVITTGTVDSVSVVGEVVGEFTIQRSAAAVDLANGTDGLGAIKGDTDDIGVAGAGLTAIPWNAAWDAEAESEATDALNAYDPPTNAEMEARTLVAASYATAAVLGALADAAADGDPTATDTLMQYVKQLVNILVGTTGIVTFPAEAAPANNISLAEVIRAIAADVTGIDGALAATLAGYHTKL